MSRRLLQIFVAIAGGIEISGGAVYLLLGLEGMQYIAQPMPELPAGDAGVANLDQLFRALAGIWFVLGLMLFWMIPRIETHSVWFRFACAAMFAMGVGRMASFLAFGEAGPGMVGAAVELVNPAILAFWQSRVARATDR